MITSADLKNPRIASPEPMIRDYPAVILRGKWVILGIIAACTAAALLYTKLRDPVYQATSAILIDTKSTQFSFATPSFGIRPETIIKNELEVLKSHGLARDVAQRMLSRLYVDSAAGEVFRILLPPAEEAGLRSVTTFDNILKRLARATEFNTERESDVIKITVRSSDPREAALIANLYARTFHDRNLNKSREKSRYVKEFLGEQLKEKRQTLDQLEASLQQYMETKGIVSLDDEARSLIAQLAQLEANRDAADITLQSLNRTLATYQDQLQSLEKSVSTVIGQANDPYIRQLQERLAELEVQRDVAVAQNPGMAGTDLYREQLSVIGDRITALRGKLEKRTEEYLQTLLPSGSGLADPGSSSAAAYLRQIKQKVLETQIESQAQQAKKRATESAIRQYEREFERIPGKNIQYARLQRARLSTEKLFVNINDKYNEATIAEQSQFGYIEVIDEASVPVLPASPNLLLNLAVGIALGAFLGLFVVVVREYRDARIHAPEDFRTKGLTLASVVLDMTGELRKGTAPVKMSRFGRPIDSRLLAELAPLSPVAEAFRKLRTAVQFEESEYSTKSILVTSPNPAEGKSVIAANLAIALARSGKMTLLVDANLRKPVLHAMFDLYREPGLSDLILQTVPTSKGVQLTSIRNLHVLAAGTASPAGSELLSMQAMAELYEEAKREYDLVVFDAPPVLDVTDAVVLATMADTVLLVTAAGSTRMEEIERSVEALSAVARKSLKCILNRFDPRRAYGLSYARSGYSAYGPLNGQEQKPRWNPLQKEKA